MRDKTFLKKQFFEKFIQLGENQKKTREHVERLLELFSEFLIEALNTGQASKLKKELKNSCFESLEFQLFFSKAFNKVSSKDTTDYLEPCVPGKHNISRIINFPETNSGKRMCDFMAFYLGYVGYKGFTKNKSILDVFDINKEIKKKYFDSVDLTAYKSDLTKNKEEWTNISYSIPAEFEKDYLVYGFDEPIESIKPNKDSNFFISVFRLNTDGTVLFHGMPGLNNYFNAADCSHELVISTDILSISIKSHGTSPIDIETKLTLRGLGQKVFPFPYIANKDLNKDGTPPKIYMATAILHRLESEISKDFLRQIVGRNIDKENFISKINLVDEINLNEVLERVTDTELPVLFI
jgi:hypothetical protein